jgi:hypothetical protein
MKRTYSTLIFEGIAVIEGKKVRRDLILIVRCRPYLTDPDSLLILREMKGCSYMSYIRLIVPPKWIKAVEDNLD